MWKKHLTSLAAIFSILMLSSCSIYLSGSMVENGSSGAGNNNNSPSAQFKIQNIYGRTGFMDQVKASDTTTDCVANDATDITDCIKTNGSWELILPGVTSCDGLVATEKLGLFDWTCSDADGKAVFTSTMKDGISLSDFLDPGAFKNNKLTITDSNGKTIAETEEEAWFTDTVQVLPASTSGTNIIPLTQPGIYTFGPSASPIMTNTIGIAVDKTAVVGLGDAELKFNAGCVESSGYNVCTTVATTSNFDYIEGNFVSPPAATGTMNFTVAVMGTNLLDPSAYSKFVDLRDIQIIKNPAGTQWGTQNEPEGIVMMGKFHRISGSLMSDGLTALDVVQMGTDHSLISADITAGNSYKPGISLQSASSNIFSGAVNISNVGTAGMYLRGNGNIFSGDINISDMVGMGFYLDGTQNTIQSNITISDVGGVGMHLSGSQNILNGEINISNVPSSSGIYMNGSQNTINSNITISNTKQGGFHLVGAKQNVFSGNITISNDLNVPLDLTNDSSNNTFTGTITISGAPMEWAPCLNISNGDGSGGIGLPSNSNIFSGALNLSNCSHGLDIKSAGNNSISGLVTAHDVRFAVYLLGNAQLNSITSLNPTSNITNYDVLIVPKEGEASPANNTVTSYDSSIFASCGIDPYLEDNTTSCPPPLLPSPSPSPSPAPAPAS